MTWKVGDKCWVMTKEGKPICCLVRCPAIPLKTWKINSQLCYFAVTHEDKMFRSKKELLSHYYGA